MVLEDMLVNAKNLGKQSADQWLHLQFQQSRIGYMPQLEARILRIEEGVGVTIVVDKIEQRDLPLLDEYSDRFVCGFLGYVNAENLSNTKKVTLLLSRKEIGRTILIKYIEYSIEHIGAGNFQARCGGKVLPIIRKLNYEKPNSCYHLPPQESPQQVPPREGVFRVIVGTVRDLYRAIRSH